MYLDALTPEYNGVFLSVKYVMTVSIINNYSRSINFDKNI